MTQNSKAFSHGHYVSIGFEAFSEHRWASPQEVPPEDLDEHRRALRALHQRAIAQQEVNPVSFGFTNAWYDAITADKKHHLEHFTRGMT